MIKKRSFGMYLLLTIITCGIYGIYFWYQYTEDFNRICEGEGKASPNYIIVILLSMITCGIYAYVWYYSLQDRMQRVGNKNGVFISENGTTVLLWFLLGGFLCGIGPFVAMHILIKNMNLLAEDYNNKMSLV
jgi:drug/metabolite transporter (DMT)-like permease